MNGIEIKDLYLGQSASYTKTITESDVYLFAGITGDVNPAHINETYANNSHFKGRIAHGMLSAGLISAVIGVQLPGPGSIYASQTLKFLAPVRFNDTITATVEITDIIPEKNRVTLKTYCINQDGIIVTQGEAIVLPPR
ncbi:MaoC family dehydratase [Clostridium beijerinckii]|uniref:MaoC family dehydratase n=1 Tax=Clostridium beijerinckii TaxID=1520 RepID=UPI00080A16AD|nr:MaoC family dehydratase [Clostridium beijerinckii]OCB01077.1 enoyl-CoA hydratase [Clostridium beijerinckii]